MFGLGFIELTVIAVAALVFVGPQKLPGMMKQFGRFFVQARRMSQDVRDSFDTVIEQAEKDLQKEDVAKVKQILSQNPNTQETAKWLDQDEDFAPVSQQSPSPPKQSASTQSAGQAQDQGDPQSSNSQQTGVQSTQSPRSPQSTQKKGEEQP